MSERDIFLTESVCGERVKKPEHWSCGTEYALQGVNGLICPLCSQIYFSDWEGFGKLWEWAQEQEWFQDLMESMWDEVVYGTYRTVELIVGASVHPIHVHPDRFANAVYEFLKGRES